MIVSEAIVAEYLAVARRPKFAKRQALLLNLIRLLCENSFPIAPRASPFRAIDRDDQPYLDAAFAAEADILVTGNLRDFPSRRCGVTDIVTPREFLAYQRR